MKNERAIRLFLVGDNTNKRLPVLLLFLLPLFSFAQQKPANESQILKETPAITANLDSLVNVWYMKNTAPQRAKKVTNIYGFKPDEVPDYPDSIYAQRLAKMAKESGLPYTYNSNVRAFIDLYAVRKRDLVEKMLDLSDYYFPIYEDAFIRYDIPVEIRYLSVVESALNAEAVSRANAVGLWQFMYPTGRLYGLKVTDYVDDRKDPYRATDAAAQYLKDLYNTFGDWFLALAAYNCGPGNINKAIRRSGGKKTFWEVFNYLPMETRGYVPAFIAASYVFTYNKEHNLYPQAINLPTLVDTVYVNAELNFKTLETCLNLPEELLRDLNPQFKKYRIPADADHRYELRLPAAKAALFAQYKDTIYSYQKKQYAAPRLVYMTHSESTALATSKMADSTKAASNANTVIKHVDPQRVWVSYTVKYKDQLPEIARLFNVDVSYLMRWNGLKSYNTTPGRRLLVYVTADKASYYRKVNIMTLSQKRKTLGLPMEEGHSLAVSQQNSHPVQAQKPDTKVQYYVVQKGDTIWSIAQRFPGVSVEDIKRVNNLTDKHSIRVGQKIKIIQQKA